MKRGSARSLRAGSCAASRDSPGGPFGNFFDLEFFLLHGHERHLQEECPDRTGWEHFRGFFEIDGSAAITCDFKLWRRQNRSGEEARKLPGQRLNILNAGAVNNGKDINRPGLCYSHCSVDIAGGGVADCQRMRCDMVQFGLGEIQIACNIGWAEMHVASDRNRLYQSVSATEGPLSGVDIGDNVYVVSAYRNVVIVRIDAADRSHRSDCQVHVIRLPELHGPV